MDIVKLLFPDKVSLRSLSDGEYICCKSGFVQPNFRDEFLPPTDPGWGMDMAGSAAHGKKVFSVRFFLYRLLPVVIFLGAGAITLLVSYINSPPAAAKISAILAERLDLPVTISALRLHGDTLIIKGVVVGNPSGFADSRFVSVDAVSVAPGWQGLFLGRRSLRLLNVDGARIDIRKGSDGGWNVAQLRKRFSGGKGGAELFIDDLRINNGEILVNGKGLRGIALQLRNIASKGSDGAITKLAFDDEAGNRYAVTGSFRAGAEPEAELSLEAPSLALAGLAATGRRLTVAGGTGSLRVKAALHAGIVRSSLAATFRDAALQLQEGNTIPLSGSLSGAATYDMKQDLLQLEQAALVVDEILEMRATGHGSSLKSGLSYDLRLDLNRFDIGRGAALLPGWRQAGTRAGGTVTARGIRIAGRAHQGITVGGMVSLRKLMVSRRDRLLINGVGSDVKIATANNTIRAVGTVTQEAGSGNPLLESISAPYAVVFSGALRPQSVDLPGFRARVLGLPLTGSFSMRPGKKDPFSLALQMPVNRLKAGSYGELKVAAGSAGMSLDLSGADSANFSGSASLSVAGLNGSIKGERFALGSSDLKADFRTVAGQYSAAGQGTFETAAFKGLAAGGRFGFSAADGLLQLDNCALRVADASITVARLSAVLPRKGAQQSPKGYPLEVQLAGGAVSRGDLKLTGIAASLRGEFAGAPPAKRFAGSGALAAEKFLWRGREIGVPRADLVFSGSGGSATLAGAVLGGTLGGALAFNPYAVGNGVEFDLSLKGIELAQLAQLLEKKGAVAVSGGRLTVSTRGSYARKDGVACRFRGEGEGVSVAGRGGKGLLANAGLQFDGSLAQGRITLAEAVFRIGAGAAVQMKGEVANVFSPQRDGMIAYTLSRAPVSRIVDLLANGLPRFLQEASLSGDMAAAGSLGFRNKRTTLQGSVQLDDAAIDAASRKLKVTGISGSIPFSLGFPAGRTASPEQSLVVSREKYAQHLDLLNREKTGGSLLKIGRIIFGPLEFTGTAFRIKAADGIIEVLSFASSLTTGRILGQGYAAFSQGVSYGGDLLLNNLSLQQVCALFPKISGYVSGRVDGIAMLEGHGTGAGGLNGYAYFWTRPGDGEKMLVSREFLQKLAGKNLQGFFFRSDHPYDKGEVMASLNAGYLTFDILDISNTNFFGVRDLKVTVTETQNRIALEHLLDSISQAAKRGKGAAGSGPPAAAEPPPAFKWDE